VTVFDRTARARAATPAGLSGGGVTAGLLASLAAWLPLQRWFPGRGATLTDLAVISDVTLQAGDPALRHLVLETPLRTGPARFQVLVGYRRELPAALEGALICREDGVACYEALHDAALAEVLLHAITDQRLAEHLRFVREPTAPPQSRYDASGAASRGRLLGAEQSNTSLVFGDIAILKVLRRLFPGANPDLEVADALARLGSARVAAPYGWTETDLDGEPVLLAVLSQFLAGASDGWTMALASLQQLYTRHGTDGQEAISFTREARELGQATAELHADMAKAFGSRDMTADELTELAGNLNQKLTDAIDVVPELAAFEARIRSGYDDVARLRTPVRLQRIHGDYHLGQVLKATQGWVALDFEGEPAVPLAVRRAPAPVLRDVAGMLRSFDYAARHQLIGHHRAQAVTAVADGWVRECQAAFCDGYSAAGGSDPDVHGMLLRALTLEKAVYEVIYEYRHRPSWLEIPLSYVAAA
jgi:maltokinase